MTKYHIADIAAAIAFPVEPCPRCGNQPKIKHNDSESVSRYDPFFKIKCCQIAAYSYTLQEALNIWRDSVEVDLRYQKAEARTAEREGLASAIERALQSDKSALIVMAELRSVLVDVVGVLRAQQAGDAS